MADQGEAWAQLSVRASELDVASPTGAMRDLYASHAPDAFLDLDSHLRSGRAPYIRLRKGSGALIRATGAIDSRLATPAGYGTLTCVPSPSAVTVNLPPGAWR